MSTMSYQESPDVEPDINISDEIISGDSPAPYQIKLEKCLLGKDTLSLPQDLAKHVSKYMYN